MRAKNRAFRPVLEILESRRLFSAGQLDPTFNAANTPGYIRDTLGPNFGAAIGSVAIDPSTGDIIVAGSADGHLAVARYDAQGNPDTSFIGDSVTTYPVPDHPGVIAAVIGDFDTATNVLVRPDGKIVVAGWLDNGNGADLFAMALNSDGSLDRNFDNTDANDPSDDGVAVIEANGDQTAFDMIGSGNDVYVIGSGDDTLAIAKFTPTGPDPSFGTNGLLSVQIAPDLTITSATLQPGGKMVVAGVDNAGGLIARIDLSNGTLDTTFGPSGDGTIVSPIHYSDSYNDIVQDSQGRLLVLGSYIITSQALFPEQAAEVQRFGANGNLDTTFGGANGAPAGEAEFLPADPLSGYIPKTYIPNRMALDAQGRIVFTGTSRDATGADEIDSVITARFTAAGAPDNSFGNSGVALNAITGNFDGGQGIAIQSDGKIVVGGTAAQTDFLTLRYTTDAPPPTVQQVSYAYATSPNTLAFTFNEPITSGLSAITIQRTSDGLTLTPTGYSYNPTTHEADFTFNAPIPDGAYTATLAAAGVISSGTPMSSNYVFNFFALAGDANHDGMVNVADLFVLSQNWLMNGRNFTQGDFNYDGTVNMDDLKILAANWGKTASGISLAPMLGPLSAALLPSPPSPPPATPITAIKRPRPTLVSQVVK